MGKREQRSDERLIIVFLGAIASVCIVGIIVLDAVGDGLSSDALLTIGSLCVGALAGRISQQGRPAIGGVADQDAYEIIGHRLTKQVIAEALRNMQ